jgi:hydrogenase/urease accessory protein HupE
MKAAAALLTVVLAMWAEPALAHPPPLGVRGFWGGVLHPVFVTDHVGGASFRSRFMLRRLRRGLRR